MRRLALTAAASILLLGAARPETVDYRLGLELQPADAPPVATVEMRFRGDADGETRLELPNEWASGRELWRYVYDVQVSGAQAREDGPAVRVLTHRPNAKVTVRYRIRTAYEADPVGKDGNPYKGPLIRPQWMALLGDFAFATPEGREHQPATFRWGRTPKDWKLASDLEHGRKDRPMTVQDIVTSATFAGPALTVVERPISGGVLRYVAIPNESYPAEAFADQLARVVSAERAFWNDVTGPYLVGFVPLVPSPGNRSSGGTGRGDAFVLYATPGLAEQLRWTVAHEHTHTWIAARTGRQESGAQQMATGWFSEGFSDFYMVRTLTRAGEITPAEAVARLDGMLTGYDANPLREAPGSRIVADYWKDRNAQKLPYQRGALLALKWDEAIRQKTGGKADLDDVILQMRDHYQRFPGGKGPDVVTGIVSAAWVKAQIDLRPEIARYADGGALVDLPEQLFDGCVDMRLTVTPAFDAGFDYAGSFEGKVVKGVRARGPAWNSGLRDGMRIDKVDLKAGDMTREVVLVVRPARGGKARTIRFWPYGDKDVETRRLQLAHGLSGEALAACGRRIGGL
jgi:predicted metalloprotease with PDZ domain